MTTQDMTYLVDLRAKESACSGMPYALRAPINEKSNATAVGPFGFVSWCDLKFSSHAPGSEIVSSWRPFSPSAFSPPSFLRTETQ